MVYVPAGHAPIPVDKPDEKDKSEIAVASATPATSAVDTKADTDPVKPADDKADAKTPEKSDAKAPEKSDLKGTDRADSKGTDTAPEKPVASPTKSDDKPADAAKVPAPKSL